MPPDDRPAAASEIDRELEEIAEVHGTAHASPRVATRERAGRPGPGGAAYWGAVILLAALAAAGVAALVGLGLSGPEPRAKWGYSAATLAFLLSATQAVPILAFATRAAGGLWGVPLRRAADLFALAGLVTTPLFLVLLAQLPDWQGRPSIWSDWPGAPRFWDGLAVGLLGLLGLALLYLSALPDLAAVRDARGGRLAGRLALGWRGTVRQWRVLRAGIVLAGSLYLVLFVFVHLLLAADLAISLVPGWGSAVIPPYHALSALQAGIAATVLVLAALRRFGGLGRYAGVDPFWNAGKLLLATAPLLFYLLWSEFLTFWYGNTPRERWLLEFLTFGPYFVPFAASAALTAILPVLLLVWHGVRFSIGGPTLVAALVLIGSFFDRVRIYVAAWSAADLPVDYLASWVPTRFPGDAAIPGPALPTAPGPTMPDLLVMLGMPAAVGLLYLLALRLLPAVSLWEYHEDGLLRVARPFVKTAAAVVARPD
jgi:hypothetical protein